MQLHPRFFGRNLRENIVSKLMKDVEGTCRHVSFNDFLSIGVEPNGRHGFVVAITGIENIGKGLIRDGTGFVTFPVKYQCVVFRPFKGEILEAVVTMVNKMGFFAEAGPVQIFVSNHLIPDDMEFQTGDMPNYTTSDGSVKIQKDSEVRLKIIGTRVDATEIVCNAVYFLSGGAQVCFACVLGLCNRGIGYYGENQHFPCMLPSPDGEIYYVHSGLHGLSALLLQLAPICLSPGQYNSFSCDVALDKCDPDVNEF
ncbi:hypothetical protein DKX38_025617 [Salix brachista]|uniref:DNA-directed RNA polymerase subunit n=1 Tax=Salix brachista TaxID=2182728 RepID=A0A5N5JPH6_9ROSI|nr:hypothetical protein DKX38_025617 [Salix brachista]